MEVFESPILADDERWTTKGHPGGTQSLGHDLCVVRYLGGKRWTPKVDGRDGSENEDHLVWHRPVYAKHDGIVLRSWRNAPNNPRPGVKRTDLGDGDGSVPTGGNHVLVRHDDASLVLYAHFQPGTVPTDLCPETATHLRPGQTKGFAFPAGAEPRIRAGQRLGLAGNSTAPSHSSPGRRGETAANRLPKLLDLVALLRASGLSAPWC